MKKNLETKIWQLENYKTISLLNRFRCLEYNVTELNPALYIKNIQNDYIMQGKQELLILENNSHFND